MKNILIACSLLALLFSHAASASSGTITFRGAIVNTPCVIPAETWMNYAQHPANYKMARTAAANPSCAGPAATQSVRVSRYIPASLTSTTLTVSPAKAIVTVVYD